MKKNEILDGVLEYAARNLNTREFVSRKTIIPASGAVISSEDVQAIVEATFQFWYTEYKKCAEFERELGKVMGKNYVKLCNSGSSANLLAISAASELNKGKYIITCATNFPTTVAPIYQNNKIPIYVDIDPYTLSPNLHQVAEMFEKYDDEVCAIVLAHTLGFPYKENEVFDLLRYSAYDKNYPIFIADCCDALGAKVNKFKFPVGSFADIVTLSFFPAHHITSGEGGAVLTNVEEYFKIIESYANWGRDCFCAPGQSNTCGKRFEHEWEKLPTGWDHKYTFTRLGYNLKMTELQAALGLSQLSRLKDFWKRRSLNFMFLRERLIDYGHGKGFISTVEVPFDWSTPSPFGFPVIVNKDAPFTKRELITFLEENKIATREVFAGNITRQPGYQNLPYIATTLDGSDFVMNNVFWIGCWVGITQPMLDYIVEVFYKFMERYR